MCGNSYKFSLHIDRIQECLTCCWLLVGHYNSKITSVPCVVVMNELKFTVHPIFIILAVHTQWMLRLVITNWVSLSIHMGLSSKSSMECLPIR